jgi:fatty acid desaturase
MRSRLPRDTPVILALFVWVCTLPLVGLLVVPFFGWGVGIMVAVALLIAILIMCWLLCFGALINLLPWTGWPSKKAHDNQETRQ